MARPGPAPHAGATLGAGRHRRHDPANFPEKFAVRRDRPAGRLPFHPPPGLAISRHKTGANRSVLAGPGARLLTLPPIHFAGLRTKSTVRSHWGAGWTFRYPPLGAARKKFPKLARVKIWLTVRSCSQVGQRLTPPPPTWRVVTRTDAVPRHGSRPRGWGATGGGGAQARRRGAGRAGHHTAHPRGRAGRSGRSSGRRAGWLLLLAQIFREPHPRPAH